MNSPQSPTSPQNDPEGTPHPHSGVSRNLAPSSASERGFLQPASIQDFRIGDVFAVYHDDDVFAPSTYRVIAPLVCRKLDVSGYVVRLIADVVQASDGGVVTVYRPDTPYRATTEEKAHAILVRNANMHRDEYKLSEKDE